MIVRLGEPEDIEAAVDIFARSSAERRARRGPAAQAAVDETRATLRSADTWFFIAVDDGTPVGMAALMPSRENQGTGDPIPGVCHLGLLFVAPERWGEAIGAFLLDAVIADASGRGFDRLDLVTHDDNERAHRLYRSRGFERTGWSSASFDPANGMVSEWARDL